MRFKHHQLKTMPLNFIINFRFKMCNRAAKFTTNDFYESFWLHHSLAKMISSVESDNSMKELRRYKMIKVSARWIYDCSYPWCTSPHPFHETTKQIRWNPICEVSRKSPSESPIHEAKLQNCFFKSGAWLDIKTH